MHRYCRLVPKRESIHLGLFEPHIFGQEAHCFIEVSRQPSLCINRIVFLEYHPEYFLCGLGPRVTSRAECVFLRQRLIQSIAFPAHESSATTMAHCTIKIAAVRKRLRLPPASPKAVLASFLEDLKYGVLLADSFHPKPINRLFRKLLECLRQEQDYGLFLTLEQALEHLPKLQPYVGIPLQLPLHYTNPTKLDIWHPFPFFTQALADAYARQKGWEFKDVSEEVQQRLRHPIFRPFTSKLWPAIEQVRTSVSSTRPGKQLGVLAWIQSCHEFAACGYDLCSQALHYFAPEYPGRTLGVFYPENVHFSHDRPCAVNAFWCMVLHP